VASVSRTLNGRLVNDETTDQVKRGSVLAEGSVKPVTSSRAMHTGDGHS